MFWPRPSPEDDSDTGGGFSVSSNGPEPLGPGPSPGISMEPISPELPLKAIWTAVWLLPTLVFHKRSREDLRLDVPVRVRGSSLSRAFGKGFGFRRGRDSSRPMRSQFSGIHVKWSKFCPERSSIYLGMPPQKGIYNLKYQSKLTFGIFSSEHNLGHLPGQGFKA